MKVEWCPIGGYEGMYEVSSDGQVRSVARVIAMPRGGTRHQPEILLKPFTDRYGYLAVRLCKSGRHRTRPVHRLVAEAFLSESWFDGAQVCHVDGNSQHNAIDNLRWGTGSANILDQVRHGRHNRARKTHCPQNHPYDDQNTIYSPTKWGRSRHCRACKNARDRARSAEQKLVIAS